MKNVRLLFLFALVATALGTVQGQSSTATPAAATQPATAIVTPEIQAAPIRILTPTAGQTLTSNFVNLRFELARPALSREAVFVQLDSADPVSTTSTDYTFPELQAGVHNIHVMLADASGSPVQFGSASVQFKVPSLQPDRKDRSRSSKQRAMHTATGAPPAAPIPPELRNDGDPILPLAGSPLPLLSLIGFGLLIGGAAQAMRSR